MILNEPRSGITTTVCDDLTTILRPETLQHQPLAKSSTVTGRKPHRQKSTSMQLYSNNSTIITSRRCTRNRMFFLQFPIPPEHHVFKENWPAAWIYPVSYQNLQVFRYNDDIQCVSRISHPQAPMLSLLQDGLDTQVSSSVLDGQLRGTYLLFRRMFIYLYMCIYLSMSTILSKRLIIRLIQWSIMQGPVIDTSATLTEIIGCFVLSELWLF